MVVNIEHKFEQNLSLDRGIPKRQTKYSNLNKTANQIARFLIATIKSKGFQSNLDGDWLILVCMKPSDDLITALLAIWKAGAAYLPIDVEMQKNRIDFICTEALPVLVIHDDSYSSPENFSIVKSFKFEDLKAFSSEESRENIPDEMMLTKGLPDTKAVVIYTSGSTGTPKGVRFSHHSFYHRVNWQFRTYPYSSTEEFCVFKTATNYVDHLPELWCPLFSAKTLVVVPKEITQNPENFVPILDEYRIERLIGVPTLLRGIILYLNSLESNKTKFMLTHVKLWISSGEPLSVQLATEFFEYFQNERQLLANFYGCTELNCDACFFVLNSKAELDTYEKIPIGYPLPNSIVYILDSEMNQVPQGEIGEICCAGVIVGDGYVNNLDIEGFIDNPMRNNMRKSKFHALN